MAPYPHAALIDELADSLAVKDDSFKALLSDLVFNETVYELEVAMRGDERSARRLVRVRERTTKMVELVRRVKTLPVFDRTNPETVFWNRFGALYLPRLARAYTRCSNEEIWEGHEQIDFWLPAFQQIIILPIFSEFARRHPQDSSDAVIAFMRGWQARRFPFSARVISILDGSDPNFSLQLWGFKTEVTALTAHFFSPTTFNETAPVPGAPIPDGPATLSSEARSLKLALETVIKDCDAHFEASPERRWSCWDEGDLGLRELLTQLAIFLRLGPDEEKELYHLHAWGTCSGSPASELCTERDGKNMTCARCRTACYCGPAHQLDHWPTHKHHCVKPDW